ncbi:MAG: Nif3-like dinuclear metal center hexameric protein [Opitutales bacterium]|nr:Nif3-like dinuclear metal center hexameric protein [Opitutales bacterium]
MATLSKIVQFCETITCNAEFKDYKGAYNGLQIENNGTVQKIGASVDASLECFEKAIEKGIDFLICHHGPFWGAIVPLTGLNYRKMKLALDHNLAVYGSHLPLDAHAEIGNNVLLAKAIGLAPSGQFGEHEGKSIGWYCDVDLPRDDLKSKLLAQFPKLIAMEHGSQSVQRVGIMTGSGASMLPELATYGIDTLITGECSQHHFAQSQELGINLYLGGHYATEVFAVQALGEKVSKEFGIDLEFVSTDCPL